MRFPLFVRSLVSLSASTQYPSDLIANLFDSTLVFHSYQSTMFHTLMGLDVRRQKTTWCQIQQDNP